MEKGGNGLKITHLNKEGDVNMVDVSGKEITKRKATAEGLITFPKNIADQLKKDPKSKKGNIFSVAKIAGINAAKKTSELVLLCHQINLKKINITTEWKNNSVLVKSEAITKSETGVEIEAINAVMIALLNIYDMTKSLTTEIEMSNIKLVKKEK